MCFEDKFAILNLQSTPSQRGFSSLIPPLRHTFKSCQESHYAPDSSTSLLPIAPTTAHGVQGAGAKERMSGDFAAGLSQHWTGTGERTKLYIWGKSSKDYLNVRAFLSLEPGNLGLSPGSATDLLCDLWASHYQFNIHLLTFMMQNLMRKFVMSLLALIIEVLSPWSEGHRESYSHQELCGLKHGRF